MCNVLPKRSFQRSNRACAVEPLENRTFLSAAYSFQAVAKVGDPLPNPADGVFTSDFEPGTLNDRGQLAFTSEQGKPNVATDLGEAVFVTGPQAQKPFATLMLPGQTAPGGGVFGGYGTFNRDAINEAGDAAFIYTLDNAFPPSPNVGVYRYSHVTGQVTPVEVPGVTPVPGGAAGDVFHGAYLNVSLNNRGTLVFIGVIPTTKGFDPTSKLGQALFKADAQGQLSALVLPGDPAPGGSTFDSFTGTSLNQRGDIAFEAHVASDLNLLLDGENLGSMSSVYLRHAGGKIDSIAHQGDAAPGGGYFDEADSPSVNGAGQVAFVGSIGATAPTASTDITKDPRGVFLYSHGQLLAVARPGTPMPGGGKFATEASTPTGPEMVHLNDRGQIVFDATLDNGDTGIYAYSHGSLSLIAKTGSVLPGIGTLAGVEGPGWSTNNNRGQIAFAAVLADGTPVMLLATPNRSGDSGGKGADHDDIAEHGAGGNAAGPKQDSPPPRTFSLGRRIADVLGRSSKSVF